ncbi:AAA family ATPase [Gephyromycinifex aptenodytis]|uniref:AAA family ATPase n=1 Tax=Gephyromycinifex aptenodytis TaxID=2716227 RepID=UPI001446D585|nr:AAA family ATPase [Gephyromycinifex aptenodytis]
MPASSQPAPEPRPAGGPREFRDEIVADVVRGWRRDLADVGGANTLLWYRDLPEGTLDLTTVHPGGVSMLMAGGSTRLSHLVRERTAFAEARRRAQVIREKSIELRDERGLVSCFMALGMATWEVPGPQQPHAPVLLRPCTIHPIDASCSDFDLDLGTEVEVNPVLVNYLRHEQGINLDPKALAELAAVSTRFDPMRVFRELARTCAFIPGFSVTDRRVVTTFSYTKLPMVADLTEQGMDLGEHEVLAALARIPGARPLRPAGEAPADEPIDPGAELLALDADATQSRVVLDARAGGHLAVTGGPGTGKSRTIANLVAALAADGKRILLLTQARSALEAVTTHLDEAGLGSLVLDAHGDLPDAQSIARDIVATLDRRRPAREPDVSGLREQLREVGSQLESHVAAVHEVREPWGVSVLAAQQALAAHEERADAPSSTVVLSREVLAGLDMDEAAAAGKLLASVAEQGGWSKNWHEDPWYRAWVTTNEEADRAVTLVRELHEGRLEEARSVLDATLVEAGLPPAETPDHWDGALDLMAGVRKTLTLLPEDVFLQPLDYLLGATADRQYRQERGMFLGWRSRRDLRRRAESLLNPDVSLDQLHDALSAAHQQRVEWTAWSGTSDLPRVPASLDEARHVWEQLGSDLRWLSERLETTAHGGNLFSITVEELRERIAHLAAHLDRVPVLPKVAPALDRALAAGLDEVIVDLAGREVPAEQIPTEVERIWWRSVLTHISAEDPRIGSHDGDHLRVLVDEYARLDHDHVRASRDELRLKLAQRLHEAAHSHPDAETATRYAASGTGAGVPARALFVQAHEFLTDVRPCWAMSPLAVAALLPPGRWFDVVIVEEAAQLLVAHAVSGMSRAAQVIVVGDEAQPPPTGYSTAAPAPAEQADPDDVVPSRAGPTLLDVALETLPVRRLTWQYGAQDESLVAFANQRVYDGQMVTFPGTSPEPAVELVVVNNEPRCEPGTDVMLDAPADLDPETQTVLDLVRHHTRTRPEESLAVVTLSTARAELLHSAIHGALGSDPALASFWAREGAGVVSVIDRMVGERRDAAILSLGYTPQPDGGLPRRFGRLDSEYGDRVLCAALGIPRRRMSVVSSITPEAFTERRPATSGALLLRDLLRYFDLHGQGSGTPAVATASGTTDPAQVPAEAGTQSGSTETDPLLRRLIAPISRDGMVCRPNAGLGRLRVDVAVAAPDSPSRPVVAVHSDGLAHARILDLRNRERVRAEQLRRLGWEVVRVFGSDLLEQPRRELPRIHEALRAVEARGILVRRSGGHR